MNRAQFLQTIGLGFLGVAMSSQGKEVKRTIIYSGYIAGLAYYEAANIYHFIKEGQSLTLKRDFHNKYDQNAIEIWQGNFKLGFVAKRDNQVLARMMESGINLQAVVKKIKREKFLPPEGIEFEVFQS